MPKIFNHTRRAPVGAVNGERWRLTSQAKAEVEVEGETLKR